MDDGWMDGWMDEWMDGWIDLYIYTSVHIYVYKYLGMYICIYIYIFCTCYKYPWVMSRGISGLTLRSLFWGLVTCNDHRLLGFGSSHFPLWIKGFWVQRIAVCCSVFWRSMPGRWHSGTVAGGAKHDHFQCGHFCLPLAADQLVDPNPLTNHQLHGFYTTTCVHQSSIIQIYMD